MFSHTSFYAHLSEELIMTISMPVFPHFAFQQINILSAYSLKGDMSSTKIMWIYMQFNAEFGTFG